MKPFDHKFREQVENAFGSYNADHLADAGWNMLMQKHKKNTRLGLILPLWAKAASVAILLTLAGFFTYRTLIIIDEQQLVEEINVLSLPVPETIEKPSESIIEEGTEPVILPLPTTTKRKERSVTASSLPLESGSEKVVNVEPEEDSEIKSALAALEQQIEVFSKEDEVESSIEEIDKMDVKSPQTTLPLANFELEADDASEKRTHLLAGFSGMIARVEDLISTSPGVSVGLYAEHRITDKISIRPGLALAKHTYGLETFSTSRGDGFYNAPALDGLNGYVESFENNLDIVAMEIPLNFVFKLSENRKRSLFVSAGASTMVYLSQRFTGSYSNVYTRENLNTATGEITYETNRSTINLDNQYGLFEHTDLFGLANLSAGYSFPFGKGSSMLIEPFIQLPISDITSSNLRMRFGGLSLKMQFGR